ncbi:glucodextranase DOMON-like domain-containing protein [Acanthopleuribacter pedis]|uniref:SHOCT domain-containing protein n=1 Tax=Acanthopleuribacter pedis TaxID=442870 RepID=A0A8J7U3M8_9BACT|nr:glucodextranase DOMON-like domain-containing protein [Acanthopleuribacter pedis]MBO1318929.1 SHOCT domain-containing protein [Acanthopleuribacter pedis]
MLRFALFFCLLSVAAGGLFAKDVLFSVNDPRGDDFGSGGILYPANADFAKGDLDLVRFEARADRKGTLFRVVFANKVRTVGNRTSRDSPEPLSNFLRHDFFNLNVDIYIDTDGVPNSGSATTLPGRRIQLHDHTRWEKTICLTPRPPEARSLLKDYLLKARRKQERRRSGNLSREAARALKGEVEQLLDNEFFFPRRIRVRGNSIEFLVPNLFLGGKAQPDWRYLVVVSGADPEQRLDWSFMGYDGIAGGLMIMPLARGRAIEQFGLELDADIEQPPIVDVLYPTVDFQKRMLSSFDVNEKQFAALPALPLVPWNQSLTAAYLATPARETISLHVKERVAVANRMAGEAPTRETRENQSQQAERGAGKPVITRSDVVKQNIKPPAPQPIKPVITGDKTPHTRSDHVVKDTEKPKTQVDRLLDSQSGEEEKPARSVAERLRELKQLLDEGLIDQDEYNNLRKKILADL